MSNIAVRKRRDTLSDLSTITGTLGELWIITSEPTGNSSQPGQAGYTVVVHDGVTAGGWPLAQWVHNHPNATEGTAGFMSATDKTKLDALSGAGGVQTVQNNATSLPAETTINFDSNFTLTDNSGLHTTEITMSTAFFNEINSNTVSLILAMS